MARGCCGGRSAWPGTQGIDDAARAARHPPPPKPACAPREVYACAAGVGLRRSCLRRRKRARPWLGWVGADGADGAAGAGPGWRTRVAGAVKETPALGHETPALGPAVAQGGVRAW